MLYDISISEQKKSSELELLRSTLSGIDESYSWRQVKRLLQERVFRWCEKFGTWSSNRERVDRVSNRKVPQQTEVSSVLGPQNSSESRPSPEQESTNLESPISFSAWSSKRETEGEARAFFHPYKLHRSSTASTATPLISVVIPVSVHYCIHT